MPRSWVHLDVEEILRETDKAFLVVLEKYEGEFWIPFSQISDYTDYNTGDKNCTMSVSEWFANEKGFE